MRLFIAIPCMDMVHTGFMQSLLGLDTCCMDVVYGISTNTLVYDARNHLIQAAVDARADLILWLDSDMIVPPDAVRKLTADIQTGEDFVSGLYFTRKVPTKPMIAKALGYHNEDGCVVASSETFDDYHKNSLFEIAGCGFGICMMTGSLARDVVERYGAPFFHEIGFGEDFSFCLKLQEMGVKMWCDSSVKAGHIGSAIITEETYESHK